ncbi:MAG: alpha,6-mannosyltransferase [Thermoleophilaceae bacterium]|nr:alpha,6-mannosyltransferase [Thermoleophilaceae bacterium]
MSEALAPPRFAPLRTPAVTARVRSLVAGGSLALIVASGVAIAVGSAWPKSSLIRVGGNIRPGWLGGPLAGIVPHITFAQFLLLLAAMAVGYFALLLAGVELRARWVLGAIAFLHLAFVLAPPLLTSDLFSYLDYARLGALHGIDPYLHGPSAAPHDPAFALTAWRHVGSAYGPLFTVATYPLAQLSLPLAIWSLKVVAAAASLGCVALVWRIAGQLGHSPARAAALFGLNPMLLVWTMGGGHNDLLMLLLALAGVSLALASREALGGAALVAAVAVKATAGLAIPFLLLGVRRHGRAALGVAGAAALAFGVAIVAFPGDPLGVVDVLRHNQKLIAFDGVPTEVARLAGLRGVTGGVRVASTAAFVLVLIWLAVLLRRGYDWVSACGWALVAVEAASPWFLAWYTVWPLPFAAVSRDRRLLAATIGLQLYFMVNHIPHFTIG